uniref:Uncharacterized protein n=1 Tax=Erpetoichthys calabaricus TaxID=27687 RepID=A0A8C4T2F8_ERPCA
QRKTSKQKSIPLKEMGNEAFHKGDYETAVQLYSEGLEKLKDMQVLYTNRAQCNEKCIKAFVHMGRANLALKNFEEVCLLRKAREEFEEGKENATSVYELLQKLSKPNQINLYYSGGIQLLTAMIKQSKSVFLHQPKDLCYI